MKQKQANPNQGFNGVKGKPVPVRTNGPVTPEVDWGPFRDRHTGAKKTS